MLQCPMAASFTPHQPTLDIAHGDLYLSVISPGKLTDNPCSIAAPTWGLVTGERRGMNEPIVNWGLLGQIKSNVFI